MSFSTKEPVGRVKGLGSAHAGTHHWWLQRVTAVALIPLTLWLVFSLFALTDAPREEIIDYFGHPFAALTLCGFMVAGMYHALLGIQVIIEDYIHTEWLKIVTLWILRFLAFIFCGGAIVAIIMMVFIKFMSVN